MSAAQVSMSGPPSASSGARSSSGASLTERSDTSFRDTLDSASRSHDAPEPRDGREPVGQARGRKGSGSDDRGEEPGTRDEESGDHAQSHHRGETGGATELSAILAALSTASDASAEDGVDFAALPKFVSVDPAASGVGEADTGPWMPGQVGEPGETVDAERLLLLLKSGAGAGTAAADAGGDTVNIKASVIGQETHLALEQTPAEALATLAAAQDAVESAATTKLPAGGEAKTAGLGAALAQAANGAAKAQNQGGAGSMEEPGQKADAGAASRVSSVTETWTAGDGAALKDQDISGESGRQSEGRGASGSSAQQQGTGSFMATFAAASARTAGTVVDPADGGVYEPMSDQIAAEVRAELRADGLGDGSSDGVVKVLNIELKPANLGSVTVRLALKDNAITVHLETQRRDTLAVIERERDALVSALASAGYSVDGITTAPQSDMGRVQGSSLAGQADSASSSAQGGQQGPAGQGQGFGNSSGDQGRSGQTGGGHSAHRLPSDDKDVANGGIRKDANGLYV